MTPKRNDPCHCGSGKKYKHCHFKEDRDKEQLEKQAVATESVLDFPAMSLPPEMPPLPALPAANPFERNIGQILSREEVDAALVRIFDEWRSLPTGHSTDADSTSEESEGTDPVELSAESAHPDNVSTDETVEIDNEIASGIGSEEDESRIELIGELYELFGASKYEEKITILRASIEEKALDGEQTFHFFNELYYEMVKADERKRFAELVDLLRSAMPELYADQNPWFWSWEITDALMLDDNEALQNATNQLIENAGQDIDQFFPVFHSLLYHDRREVLLNAIDKFTPRVPSGKYFPGTEDEVKEKLSDLIIMNYIETHDQDELLSELNFDALRAKITPYVVELLPDGLTEFIAWAGGLESGQWAMDDFRFPSKPRGGRLSQSRIEELDAKMQVDSAVVNLRHLSFEFLHYARSVENVPLTKADLARGHLTTYIRERDWGELKRGSDSGRPRSGSRSKKGRKKKTPNATNVLLPDHKTLDEYLARFYGFMTNRSYEGAALFELVPTWVRFLQSKDLVTEEEGQQALKSMQALSESMVRLMEGYTSDPKLGGNMRAWREGAGV